GPVRFRNFQIDGRKREQPDPGTPEESWGHWGIAVSSPTASLTNDGCVHGVTARELMTGGFAVRDGSGWIFEPSTAQDVGCLDDLTPCDALRSTPEHASIPGLRSDGFGFVAYGNTIGTEVRDSHVTRATKHGIAAVFGAADVHIHGNLVESGGASGI